MEIRSEKVIYGSLFRHISQWYDVDVFLWGEDLVDKQLHIYAGKLKKLPEYDTFARRLINCGLIIVDPVRNRKMTCHPVRYDDREGIVYIEERNFLAWWPLLKKSIQRGIRMAKQNGTECRIHEPEDTVSLHYLQRAASSPVLKNDRIIYKAKELTPGEQRLNSARQSALDNPKNVYFYGKTEGPVHDRQCELIKEIRLEDFIGSDQFPEGRTYCPRCSRQLFLRIGCAPVTKAMPVCSRIFTNGGLKTSQIGRFAIEHGMRFQAGSLSEMTIRCKEDTWIIKRDGQGWRLWHNNYIRISPTERYITEGFHDQGMKEHTSMYQMLTYIAGYSWQKHLDAERMEAEAGAADSEKQAELVVVSETTRKKSSLWNRLAAYIKGLFRRGK